MPGRSGREQQRGAETILFAAMYLYVIGHGFWRLAPVQDRYQAEVCNELALPPHIPREGDLTHMRMRAAEILLGLFQKRSRAMDVLLLNPFAAHFQTLQNLVPKSR